MRLEIRVPGIPAAETLSVAVAGSGPTLAAAVKAVGRQSPPHRVAAAAAGLAHAARTTILMYLLGGPATHKALVARTGLDGGPLYHHLRELRSAGLIGPKQRDIYELTRPGRRAILAGLALAKAVR